MSKTNAVAVAVLVLTAAAGTALAQDRAQRAQKPTAQMQKVLDAFKALEGKPPSAGRVEDARKGVTFKDALRNALEEDRLPIEPETVFKVEIRTIPTSNGDLSTLVYTPEGEGPFPAIVYFHGGGFSLADPEVYDASARALANEARAVVISVDYRLAPEHPFPAAIDDASAAFTWVREHPQEFNIQPNKIAVAGESAGANLATVVALRAKKDQTPMPVFQLLVYPFLSNKLDTPSHRAHGGGEYLLGNQDLEWFLSNYLGEDWRTTRDPLAIPLRARKGDLRGLPPALIITAGLDPLKDDGTTYAKKLRAAGVAVTVRNYPGVTHEFFGMSPMIDESKQAQAQAGAALRAAFARAGQLGQL